jgi:dethiobiotin synthase
MRGVFVTGTDTGVGKTVVSAALLRRFPQALYWKPVQTGIETDDDTAEVMRLAESRHAGQAPTVRLPNPVSPHLAAQRAGVRIDLDALADWAADDDQVWIVEGAGGVLVPVNESQTMAHLMVRLRLPVLVAARTALGTINHTLLTLEALRARSLSVAGVVMAGEPNAENRAAVERYGGVPVAVMPRFDPLTPERLAEWAAPPWIEEYFE